MCIHLYTQNANGEPPATPNNASGVLVRESNVELTPASETVSMAPRRVFSVGHELPPARYVGINLSEVHSCFSLASRARVYVLKHSSSCWFQSSKPSLLKMVCYWKFLLSLKYFLEKKRKPINILELHHDM